MSNYRLYQVGNIWSTPFLQETWWRQTMPNSRVSQVGKVSDLLLHRTRIALTDFLKTILLYPNQKKVPIQSFVIVPHVSHLATGSTVDRGYHEEESWPCRHDLPLKAYSPFLFLFEA